jgi:hypothetical protein
MNGIAELAPIAPSIKIINVDNREKLADFDGSKCESPQRKILHPERFFISSTPKCPVPV